MQKLSLAEFRLLLDSPHWNREQSHETTSTEPRQFETYLDGESALVSIPHSYGWIAKTSTLGDISIVYCEGFSFDDYQPDTFISNTDGIDYPWQIVGLQVVDDDGDLMRDIDLVEYLSYEFKSMDYSAIGIAETQDIDVSERGDMETITLELDNEPDIRFTGECIAKVASSDNNASGSSFSGQAGRWTELTLYKTKGGKYVCHQIGRTRWQGERDRYSGKVCDSLDAVVAFFGHRWLAKELYDTAGIDASKPID